MLGSVIRIATIKLEPIETIIIRRCNTMEEAEGITAEELEGITAEELDQIIKDIENTPEDEFEYMGDEGMDDEEVDEIDEDEMEEDQLI
jgi:hypothetical protein